MRGHELLEHMEGIDPAFIEAADVKPLPKPKHTARYLVTAACFALIAVGAFTLTDRLPSGSDVPPTENYLAQQASHPTEQLPEEPTETVDMPEILYNPVNSLMNDSAACLFCCFGEPLTQSEIDMLAPEVLLDWMHPTGTALYYAQDNLYQISLEFESGTWDGSIEVTIKEASAPSYECYQIDPESTKATRIGSLEVTAYQYTDTLSDSILIWSKFVRGDVAYVISAIAASSEAEEAKADISEIVACYAESCSIPDLSNFKPLCEYINETLTLEQALEAEEFGEYMLHSIPNGFITESIRRYRDGTFDYLSGLWTGGYDELRWKVSHFTEEDAVRVTSVTDAKNYDLSLYPIPRAESVPDELREIVDNPIFCIEELTLEAVYARAYTSNELGDSNGCRMAFTVKYGNVLVEVHTKGVSPEWLYEQLIALSK